MKIYHIAASADWEGVGTLSDFRGMKGNVLEISVNPELLAELQQNGLIYEGDVAELGEELKRVADNFMFNKIESLQDTETSELYDLMEGLADEQWTDVMRQPNYQARVQRAKELKGII